MKSRTKIKETDRENGKGCYLDALGWNWSEN